MTRCTSPVCSAIDGRLNQIRITVVRSDLSANREWDTSAGTTVGHRASQAEVAIGSIIARIGWDAKCGAVTRTDCEKVNELETSGMSIQLPQ